MLVSDITRRYGPLFVCTTIGGWLGIRIQFGLRLSAYFSEELALLGIALIMSAVWVAMLIPVSRLLQRTAARKAAAVVLVVALTLSLATGLWVYVWLLHRPLALVLERDWPYLLCFALGGVGYAVGYAVQRRI
jgi:hypothetical protein